MLCYRFEALVASQLSPEDFGAYMAVGTKKNTHGNVLFFEVDPALHSTYFRLDDIPTICIPHTDGSPKRSKYISTYRVLEHLDPAVLGNLYLATADGRVLGMEASTFIEPDTEHGPNLFQELCPVTSMVVSTLSPAEYGKFMTDPDNPLAVPRLFFTDLLLERDATGRLAGNLPYENPDHIIECIKEMEANPHKPTKNVTRAPHLHGFFRTIRRGFFLGDQHGIKFYQFPSREDLDVKYHQWWHSASESLVM
jgi:hypothetical protein